MPDFEIENKYPEYIIAGVDEAGRGPWAGPVVAGAVIIKDKNLNSSLLNGLNDSKKLSVTKRESLYKQLFEAQNLGLISIGIGQASVVEIDELNILQATFLAMQRAIRSLPETPTLALIDGNRIPQNSDYRCQCVIKGDAKSYSISAASIIAKVYRDNIMTEISKQYPYYGFEKNAGYGTSAHISGIKKYGITQGIHRLSYKPIAKFLANQ
ncbi:MAG: ribonuclease HII [Alphaproteobacteria bacterium]|nr:ribonuclease HII [Alphaproteobacteria bacterium]